MTALSRRLMTLVVALALSCVAVFATVTSATASTVLTGFTQPTQVSVWVTGREVDIAWAAGSGPGAGAIELLYGDAGSLQLVGVIATVDLRRAGNCRWLVSGAYALPTGTEYSIRAGDGSFSPQFSIVNPARPFSTPPGAPFTNSQGCIKGTPGPSVP